VMHYRASRKTPGQQVARRNGNPASNADPACIDHKGKPNREDRKEDGTTGLPLFATSMFQSCAQAFAGQKDRRNRAAARRL